MKQTSLPKLQENFKKGTVKCPRCGGTNYRGNYVCGHGMCMKELPGFEPKRTSGGYGFGLDMDKVESGEVEGIAESGYDASRMYRGAADKLMDTIDYRMKHATTESELSGLRERKQNLGLRFYNRHYGTNFKS